MRNRLQVNDDPFEFGKIGVEHDPKNPTMPTEWDDYYVHEMRYRRPVKKFCVKTYATFQRVHCKNSNHLLSTRFF